MAETPLWPLIRTLGKNIPPASADDVFYWSDHAYWNKTTLADLKLQLQKEKVVLQAYDNAQRLNAQRPTRALSYLTQELEAEYTRRLVFRETVMPDVRTEVSQILTEAGVRFLFVKGSSLERYPAGYVRQMNDLDILFETWDDMYYAARALTAKGYYHGATYWEAPWMAAFFDAPALEDQLVGHINMVRYEGEHLINLDLHMVTFTVGATGYLDCDLWLRAQGNQTPTIEDKLLILVAHAANHGFFIIKDFNDIYALLSEYTEPFDWSYFCSCIQRSSLAYAAVYALGYVKQHYNEKVVSQSILDILIQYSEQFCAKMIALTTEHSKEWRPLSEVIMHALHTFIFERKNHGLVSAIRQSSRFAKSSLWYTVLHKKGFQKIGDSEQVQRYFHRASSLLFPKPTRGNTLILIPIVDVCDSVDREQLQVCFDAEPSALQAALGEISDSVETQMVGNSTLLIRAGDAEAVVTPVELFIPTLDSLFLEDQVTALEHLLAILGKASVHLTQSLTAVDR